MVFDAHIVIQGYYDDMREKNSPRIYIHILTHFTLIGM